MAKTKISVYFTLVTFFLLILFFIAFFYVIPGSFHKRNVVFTIHKDQSAHNIAFELKKQNIIRSVFLFKVYLKISKSETDLRVGSHLLSTDYSLFNVVSILKDRVSSLKMEKVTIPEGFSSIEIAQRLDSQYIVSKNEFLEYIKSDLIEDFQEKYNFLKELPIHSVEGYLFPDTYFFQHNEDVKIVVNLMLKQFNEQIYLRFVSLNQKHHLIPKKRLTTFHNYVTLASMIEKESRKTFEMPLISSVFHNRLKRNMYLASDPTVVYAHGKIHIKRVLYRDLKIDSPYNTYKYQGLPLGPISSFGTDAFKSALFPEQTDFLFFVAKSDGSHFFSRTYQEHLNFQNNN